MTYKIACLTPVKNIKKAYENLNKIGEVVYSPDCNKEDAIKNCSDCNILFINPNKLKYRIDKEFIDQTNLKIVVSASTGTNHIDMDYCAEKSIKVISLRNEKILETITSTAEMAWALSLNLIKNVNTAFTSVKQFEWDWEPYTGRQIKDLTFGCIGFGRLGKMYGKYVEAFGAELLFSDPNVAGSDSIQQICNYADVISIHVHLDENTKNMVNFEFINSCKKQPYIINTSRGEVVNDEAIIEGLESGKIKGYATDVLPEEFSNNFQDSKLIHAAKNGLNILITPHLGGSTEEAQKTAYLHVIKMLKDQL
jgi:D-3-phosphoglycerate dehydrogenase